MPYYYNFSLQFERHLFFGAGINTIYTSTQEAVNKFVQPGGVDDGQRW